jgi:hypothetical protein
VSRALSLAAIALAVAIAGCGSDSSGDTTAPTVSLPVITSPLGTTSTAAATTTTTTPSTTSTPRKGGNYNPNAPDSATNDVPPPSGSPQEAFEKQCKQNPQACG